MTKRRAAARAVRSRILPAFEMDRTSMEVTMKTLLVGVAVLTFCAASSAIANEPNWTPASQGNFPLDAVGGGNDADGVSLVICGADNGTGLTHSGAAAGNGIF
jgi:hypothetical protein